MTSPRRYPVGWVPQNREARRSVSRLQRAEKRIVRLETALMMIRDRECVENALDPQWAAQVAREALKRDD